MISHVICKFDHVHDGWRPTGSSVVRDVANIAEYCGVPHRIRWGRSFRRRESVGSVTVSAVTKACVDQQQAQRSASSNANTAVSCRLVSHCGHLRSIATAVVHCTAQLLHFAWVEDHEKCIVVTRVCVCVCVCVCVSVCLSVCLSAAACLQYCTDADVTWGSGRGCPLVVHYWADLQSVHGMRCYGNIMQMRGRAQR